MATAEVLEADLEHDWVDPPTRALLERDAPRRRLTLAEFHALPEEDRIDRMLLRGELWEKPMTKRNKQHTRIEARIAQLIGNWIDAQKTTPGEIYSGEAGVDLPETGSGVGIDVAYFPNDSLAGQDEDERFLVGPPTLAVEILSPSDRQSELWAKIDNYLAANVPLIWIVDPHFQTVTVYRPDAKPAMISADDDLTGEPHLPGFTVPARKIFSR